MSRSHCSEYKNRRSRWPPRTHNLHPSPTEHHHPQNDNADNLIFPMSLPRSISTEQQTTNHTRTNYRRNDRSSSPDSQRSTYDSSSLSGSSHQDTAPLLGGGVPSTQNSTTSEGSEGLAPLWPQQDQIIPQRPPQFQSSDHVNPRVGRALTAADFSRRHPLSPQSSSSESSSHSGESSVGSFTEFPPRFSPPTSSTRPIPIPRASARPNHPFTPQHDLAAPHRRRSRHDTDPPLPGPSNWIYPDLDDEGRGPSSG